MCFIDMARKKVTAPSYQHGLFLLPFAKPTFWQTAGDILCIRRAYRRYAISGVDLHVEV